MRKLPASTALARAAALTTRRVDSKKILVLALSTLLMLASLSEGLRLALQSW